MLPRRIEQLARNRTREIAVRLLDEKAVFEIEHIAPECQLVGIPNLAQQQGRLPDEVKRDIGEAEVHLKRRGMPAPLAEPLPKDQRIVTKGQQVIGAGVAHTQPTQ
jgi:hypothetical protein